jgi:hypothetical protein
MIISEKTSQAPRSNYGASFCEIFLRIFCLVLLCTLRFLKEQAKLLSFHECILVPQFV